MDEEYETMSSGQSETEEARQVWQFNKLWTKALDSTFADPQVTSEELARRIVALAGVDVNILNNGQTPAVCFKPERARATMDKNGRRVEIIGVLFKPEKEGVKGGKRWTLLAENAMYSYLLPTVCYKFDEVLPWEEVYIVLNGQINESIHQIRLDGDHQKTVVIAVTRELLGKRERALHSASAMSFNFKLSWSNSAAFRELTVVPLYPIVEDKLLYRKYMPMPSHEAFRQGAANPRIRKAPQQERGERSSLTRNRKRCADGDKVGELHSNRKSSRKHSPSGDDVLRAVDSDAGMEMNHQKQVNKSTRKSNGQLAIRSLGPPLHPSEKRVTNAEVVEIDNVAANTENPTGELPINTVTTNLDPVPFKKRPGPRSKTMNVQIQPLKRVKNLSKQMGVEQVIAVPKPRDGAHLTVRSVTVKKVLEKACFEEQPQAHTSKKDIIKPAQAAKMKGQEIVVTISSGDESDSTQIVIRSSAKHSRELGKNMDRGNAAGQNTNDGTRKPFECHQCGKDFLSQYALDRHAVTIHNPYAKKYACTYCKLYTTTRADSHRDHEKYHCSHNPNQVKRPRKSKDQFLLRQ